MGPGAMGSVGGGVRGGWGLEVWVGGVGGWGWQGAYGVEQGPYIGPALAAMQIEG